MPCARVNVVSSLEIPNHDRQRNTLGNSEGFRANLQDATLRKPLRSTRGGGEFSRAQGLTPRSDRDSRGPLNNPWVGWCSHQGWMGSLLGTLCASLLLRGIHGESIACADASLAQRWMPPRQLRRVLSWLPPPNPPTSDKPAIGCRSRRSCPLHRCQPSIAATVKQPKDQRTASATKVQEASATVIMVRNSPLLYISIKRSDPPMNSPRT
jgi:hypothetical protein